VVVALVRERDVADVVALGIVGGVDFTAGGVETQARRGRWNPYPRAVVVLGTERG
jgi:hypothetical protein